MADWPVTVNEYAAGSLCNSTEYKTDFEKLRNAVNSLHARYSTLSLSAALLDTFPFAASGHRNYNVLHDNEDADEKRVLGIMQIPTWAQAVRVRQFEVYNLCNFRGADGTLPNLTGSEVFGIGVAHGASLSVFNAGSWSATTIKVFSGTGGTVADWAAADLAGYDGEDEPDETPTANVDTGLSVVVPAGNYIAIYAYGGFNVNPNNSVDANINFHCTAWMDAMVPIP
jgi:hypothetical protein